MKRKVISVLLSLGMISALVTGCSSSSGTDETTSTDTAAEASADTEETTDEAADTEETASTGEASATAGVIWYNFADTFIANARQCLNNVAYFFGTGRRFPGMGVLYDTREQISRRNLFPDVIFYEYDNI